jgi:hypothetical protein
MVSVNWAYDTTISNLSSSRNHIYKGKRLAWKCYTIGHIIQYCTVCGLEIQHNDGQNKRTCFF